MGATISQMAPPTPTFTEQSLPDLTGRVYLITGPTSGIGQHLASLLYSRNATIFLAGRSAAKLSSTVTHLQSAHPSSQGQLHSLELDLCSYDSIKTATASFLAKTSRLDVLFHNAGILAPPKGTENAHGIEVQMGVHCVGPYLLTRLLEERLKETAKMGNIQRGDVRIVWTGSVGATLAPTGGVDMQQLKNGEFVQLGPIQRYNISKAGEYFLCGVFGKRLKEEGIVSVFLDPGNLKTDLQRTFSSEVSTIGYQILGFFLHDAVKGAYTELFAGFSPEVSVQVAGGSGTWVVPFGRLGQMRKDLVEACQREADGSGFAAWCEEQVGGYVNI